MRLEQTDRPAGLGLVEALGNETHHLALVVFVGAEDVEEFKSGPLRRQFVFARDAFDHGEIEQVLAPAVEVHRLEPLERGERPVVGEAGAAVAVGRGRRRIDERRAGRGAPIEQPQRQPEIVFHQEVDVGRGRSTRWRRGGSRRRACGRRANAAGPPAVRISAICRLARLRHFWPVPRMSLTAISACPASLRLATTFEPMKPAPPVTNNIDAAIPLERTPSPPFAPVLAVVQHWTLSPGRAKPAWSLYEVNLCSYI